MKKKLKKTQVFLKEYFIFSTGERKGIITLLVLLMVLISLPFFYDILFPQQPLNIKISDIKSIDDNKSSFVSYTNNEVEHDLFSFDPNTSTNQQLEQLGFSKFNVKTIRNYVTKGGKFLKPDDLKKIYGITPEFFQKIEPYINISSAQKNNFSFDDSVKYQKKIISKKVVELNSADSLELVALYRIGPTLAHRIMEYRDKLGGFVSIDQLKELWGFDEDILFDLQGKIYVDARKAKIYELNMVTADELKTHPYFKYKLSNAIINFRKQHGNYKSLSELKNIVLVNDSVYQRITLYLKMD
jgi:DNA uptake protein ComE-like DNA-binding protein